MPPWDRYRQLEQEDEGPAPWRRYSAASRPQSAQRRPPSRGQSRDLQTEITQGLASINRGIPFAQDFQNLVRGGVSMAQGGTFQEGMRQQQLENTEFSQDFRARRPNAAAFAEGTGNALPVIATMGASAPAAATQTASRGLPLFARQSALAGATGTAYGQAYGLGTGDAPNLPWEERLDRGMEGAVVGGITGGLTPAAVNVLSAGGSRLAQTAEPLWRGALRMAEGVPTPRPNSLGSTGGNLQPRPPRRQPPTPPPPPPDIPDAGVNMVERMMSRERMGVGDLETAVGQARANPRGQAVVDLFRDTGTRTLRPMVQGPGETSGRAQQTLRERVLRAPDQIMDTLARGLRVGESRAQAVSRLEGDYRALSANAYEPLWKRPVTPQQRMLYEQRIAPLLDPQNPNVTMREIMKDAIARAERQFDLDRQLGIVQGNPTDHLGRYLHYIKGAIGDRARFEASPLRGTSGREIGSLRQIYRQFSDLIDPPPGTPGRFQGGDQAIIPDYRRITNEAGDYFTAREALDEGERFLRMSPEEVEQRIQQMTPFERRHARIALADEIRAATSGDVNRNRNVAAVLENQQMQGRIRAAFDTPEQAAEFISLIEGSGRGAPPLYTLLDNAIQWRGGSSTFANAMHGFDEATQAGVEAMGAAATGNVTGGARRGAQYLQNQLTLGMIERANNRRGQTALTRIDTEESRAFTDELLRILRQREATRGNNTAAARAASQAGGAAGGSRE
jgi:hypothetical protein